MELFQLRYAVMLLDCKNFSRAAEKLFITQPTLSQQIQRLEKELGFPLFLRNSRQVVPTTTGELFLSHARRVIHEFENLQKEVQSIQDMLESKITLGTSPLSSRFISSGIPLFLNKFPQSNLNLLETNDPNLISLTYHNEIDLAIVTLPRDHMYRDGLDIIPVEEEYVCAVLNKDHPLAGLSEIPLEQLVPFTLLFYSRRSGLRKTIFDAFEEHGLNPQETIEMTSVEARIPLIVNGAVGLLFSGLKKQFAHPDFVCVPIAPRIYSTLAVILPKKKKVSLALDCLIQIMVEESKKYFVSQG